MKVLIIEDEKPASQKLVRLINKIDSSIEVVGIIVMLSGYIVYGLNKFFPIMILDELTFMDKIRLDKLIEYISEIVETVILTTLSPEKISGEINRYKL